MGMNAFEAARKILNGAERRKRGLHGLVALQCFRVYTAVAISLLILLLSNTTHTISSRAFEFNSMRCDSGLYSVGATIDLHNAAGAWNFIGQILVSYLYSFRKTISRAFQGKKECETLVNVLQ